MVSSVAFSPDGKTLASGSRDKTIKLWDVATGKETGHPQGAYRPGVCPWRSARTARRWPREAMDETIKLWDVATGKEQATLKGHTSCVTSVAFSPDGKTLASGSEDKTIKLWDVATGKEQATLNGHTDGVLSVAFSPDGKTLASGSEDKTIKLWDVATGKEQATLKGHTDAVMLRGVQPGRQDAGLGERRQDDQAVGRGQPPSRRTSERAVSQKESLTSSREQVAAMIDRQNGGAAIGKQLLGLSDRMFAWWHRVRDGDVGPLQLSGLHQWIAG